MPCYIAHTRRETHDVIRRNLNSHPMYAGRSKVSAHATARDRRQSHALRRRNGVGSCFNRTTDL
ncbi:hypothetical protein ACNKHR_12550 [Shigella flexneri]